MAHRTRLPSSADRFGIGETAYRVPSAPYRVRRPPAAFVRPGAESCAYRRIAPSSTASWLAPTARVTSPCGSGSVPGSGGDPERRVAPGVSCRLPRCFVGPLSAPARDPSVHDPWVRDADGFAFKGGPGGIRRIGDRGSGIRDRGSGRKHEWPINRTIRRITRGYRVFRVGLDHAPRRVRITHRAAHHGRRTSLADSRTAARDRRQLRGGLDRAGRRRFLGRGGGGRWLRRGLRAATTATTTARTATPTTTASTSPTASSAPTSPATTGDRGPASSAPTPSPSPAPRTRTEALALPLNQAAGARRAAAPPARRAAGVPQTDPQTASERTVAGIPDAAHHRPGGVRRCRAAAAIVPLTRRDACPNGSY